MTMRKMLIALILSTPLIASAGPGERGHHQERHMEQLEQRLQLSEPQKKEIQQIFSEHREEMQALRERTQQRVDAVLDANQRAQMADLREERQSKWQEHKEERKDKKDKKDKKQDKRGER
jgi:periplasmic protein CpxP/Spy